MDENERPKFTVRVPVKISQADDGTIVVHEYEYISYFSDKGSDAQMFPHEYAAFCDLMLDKTIRWTAKNAETSARIDRQAILYRWWQAFIEGPLSQVPIGDEQFRKSRAGLIHHTHMNSIRKAANLSPADFKALSLAEVFAVISDIYCREHNEENRLRHLETGRNPTQGFTKPDLCDLTGYSDGAVNKRLKALGINTAGGGRPRKGDKPFSKEQVQRLLQSIIDDDGSQQFNKTKCEESLKQFLRNPETQS